MSRPPSTESVFRAVADPLRRKILDTLAAGDMTPGELCEKYSHVGRQTLSFHLGVLVSTGLATFRRRGRSVVYRGHYGRLHAIADWVNQRVGKQTT
jgi:DNA-binding transcriptional ArsR family regulator